MLAFFAIRECSDDPHRPHNARTDIIQPLIEILFLFHTCEKAKQKKTHRRYFREREYVTKSIETMEAHTSTIERPTKKKRVVKVVTKKNCCRAHGLHEKAHTTAANVSKYPPKFYTQTCCIISIAFIFLSNLRPIT